MMATRSGETATYDLPGLSYNFMAPGPFKVGLSQELAFSRKRGS